MAVLTDRLRLRPRQEGRRSAGGALRHPHRQRPAAPLPAQVQRRDVTCSKREDQPEEGEHITFVDVISNAELKWTNRSPRREYMVVTLGNRTPNVTATFFNVKYLKKSLKRGAKVMLSGEVGYFKGTLQLTHPAYLALHESGEIRGRRRSSPSRRRRDPAAEVFLSAFEREFFPIYPASKKCKAGTSTRVCARCSTCSIRSRIHCRNPFCANTI